MSNIQKIEQVPDWSVRKWGTVDSRRGLKNSFDHKPTQLYYSHF